MSTTLDSEERQAEPERNDSRPPVPPPTPVGDRLVYRTEDLFHNRREIWFEHGNEQYRLRITASGKLILTK